MVGRVRSWLREQFLAHPVFGPAVFNGGRVVGFRQVVRHGVFVRGPVGLTLLNNGFRAMGLPLTLADEGMQHPSQRTGIGVRRCGKGRTF